MSIIGKLGDSACRFPKECWGRGTRETSITVEISFTGERTRVHQAALGGSSRGKGGRHEATLQGQRRSYLVEGKVQPIFKCFWKLFFMIFWKVRERIGGENWGIGTCQNEVTSPTGRSGRHYWRYGLVWTHCRLSREWKIFTLKGLNNRCSTLEKVKQRLSGEIEDLQLQVDASHQLAISLEKKAKNFDKVVAEWKAKVEELSRQLDESQRENR